MEKLSAFFKTDNITSVLDVGTGNGAFLPILKKAYPKAKFCGVDPNAEALQEAKALFPGVSFSEMFGENLKFEDNRFDVASISMALHHLPKVKQTLKEMQRVVRSGGWIIVNEPCSDNLNAAQEVHKHMHHFRSKIDRLNGVCHNPTFARNEILQLLKDAGLSIQLEFINLKPPQNPDAKAIEERTEKLQKMLEQLRGREEFGAMKREIPILIESLKKYGFQMASCVVVIARVK